MELDKTVEIDFPKYLKGKEEQRKKEGNAIIRRERQNSKEYKEKLQTIQAQGKRDKGEKMKGTNE